MPLCNDGKCHRTRSGEGHSHESIKGIDRTHYKKRIDDNILKD